MVLLLSRQEWRQTCIVGVDCREGPPVPIPNTEVKLAGAEDTWLETARKNRFSPTQKNHLCKQVVFLRLRRASRGSFVITRFTRSETPAICPRWLRWLRHGHVAGRSLPLALLGMKLQPCVRGGWLGVIGGSLARKRTAGSSSPGKPSSPPQDFFRIFKNSQGFFTPFFQDIMVNSVLRFSPFRPACHLGNCAIFFFFFP